MPVSRAARAAAKLLAELRKSNPPGAVASIPAKTVANLVRARLLDEFPRTRFSVRSDHNSIDVRWSDGPPNHDVSAILTDFEFGGFDGSIDLGYAYSRWLSPSGRLTVADSSGTVGSGGYVSRASNDPIEEGSVKVRSPLRYLFPHREVTDYGRVAEVVKRHIERKDTFDEPYRLDEVVRGAIARATIIGPVIGVRAAEEDAEDRARYPWVAISIPS